MYEWANEMNCAVTVCDTKGIILYMNEKACRTFAKHGDLIGKNLFDCHNPQSNPQNIRSLREDHRDPWGRWKGAVMSERTCNIAGCHNPAESNGLCAHHFTRALVYGQLRVANHAASLSGAVPRGEA